MDEKERRRLNKQLRQMMDRSNDTPDPEREGLTPKQMHQLLNYPLAKESWFGFRQSISDETIMKMPVMRLVIELLNRIVAAKSLKLTTTGRLPRKIVQELFKMKGSLKEPGDFRGLPSGEGDWPTLTEIHFILRNIGWCKKRHNKLSLTTKGLKVLAGPRQVLFEAYIRYHLFQMNLGWQDAYSDSFAMQKCLPYTLFLLLKYGKEVRSERFYADNFLQAFPHVSAEFDPEPQLDRTAEGTFLAAYVLRMFSRCFAIYNWIELRSKKQFFEPKDLIVTEVFYEIFEQRPFEDLPVPKDHIEKEIESALFDAELGGVSHFSDEVPLEVMQAFHDQVRAFHSDGPKKAVPIRSLLPVRFHLLPPDEVTEPAVAKREVDRVLQALDAANIVTEPPEHLSAEEYYDFIYHIFLPTEIIPFGGGTKTFLAFDDFFDDEDAFGPEMEIAEVFLLSLFNLELPFIDELLAKKVRLGSDIVTSKRALKHLNAWRSQFREIIPLAFTPGLVEEDGSGSLFPTFSVAYKTITKAGKEEEFDGPGLVQVALEGDLLKVQGAQIPGFEF